MFSISSVVKSNGSGNALSSNPNDYKKKKKEKKRKKK
jgi:hypothetical protein